MPALRGGVGALFPHRTGRHAGDVPFFGATVGVPAVAQASTAGIPVRPQNPLTNTEGLGGGADIRSGGQLARFATKWTGAPPLPATTVRRGFHWSWVADPPPLCLPSSTQHQPALRDPILDWVRKGVVSPVPPQPCFLSRLFAVPRPDNRPPRLIIDLSRLNQYVFAPPFTLDNHGVLARLLTPPAFLATLDIAEAYTHIPMRPNLYRYLAFSYLGQLYFFHALPFGLNVAPYIFMQVLAWPLHCLRDKGISLLAYLDDIVIWHRDRDTLLAQVQQVMVFLQDMGFRLNLAKSHPYPSSSAVWLGVHWLPQTGHWHLPVEGQEAIRRTALTLLRAPLVTRRQIERLVGVINFACQVHRFLRPFLQPLAKGGTIARAADRDTPAPLPPPMREALTYWASQTPWLHVPQFHYNLPCRSLWTDASAHGWGALLQPSLTGSGEWSPTERALHVNVLELRAVLRALTFFDLRHLSLRIYTDNESVRYTLAACRTKSLALRQELIALLSALQARDLTFQVLRVPTALNVVADALSRAEPLNTEWTLSRLSFEAILRWAGPLEVDLMASPINHRLPRWVSAFPHPDAPWRWIVAVSTGPPSGPCISSLLRPCCPSFSIASSSVRLDWWWWFPGSPTNHGFPLCYRSVLPPSPPHDPLPADRIGDRLAFIRHLRTLDSTAFLQQVLSARYPRRVVDTLLAAYRPSSRRQHDLAWRHFQAWLPADVTEISRAQVLEFLQHLFDVVALSPRTILCYRAALKWPLQEAFQVDFRYEDFSRQATGFFHLRPPPSSPLPQWDLNEVLRF